MVQLGEKKDFEAQLSRLGFRHEDFLLRVRVERRGDSPEMWLSDYAVCVTDLRSSKSNIYLGGPRRRWVARFSVDLAEGYFGRASVVREPGHAWRSRTSA
jgi:hypothetical protein